MKEKEVPENKNLNLYHCDVAEHYYHFYAETVFDAAVMADKRYQEEEGRRPAEGTEIAVWEA